MCGIAGIIERNRSVNVDQLKSMCDSLSLRGPDSEGIHVDDKIGLGHRRLSVIDLQTGDQPMFSNDKSVAIVYNGEIYNFKDLRAKLVERGYHFNTQSDTEVVINGYLEFGIDNLLPQLEGMFSFALYDKSKDKVFIARDKFGEKPLYYFVDNERFAFASELKALKNVVPFEGISNKGLNYFLSLSYIPAPFTIYSNILKLNSGCYITIDSNLHTQVNRYYNLIERLSKREQYSDFDLCKRELKQLLYESVTGRMISDVPIGAFLSGGIDSSIITSIMSELSSEPINTFSIGFKEKEFDESDRAKLVAEKIKSNHTVHYLNYKDVVDLVDEIVLHFDEPFGDSSAIPTYYVAKLAREKVTVVLTGDCADELFMGYEKYLGHIYTKKYRNLPPLIKWIIEKGIALIPHTKITNSLLRKLKKVINNAALEDFDLHYGLMCLGFNDEERSKILVNNNFVDIKQNLSKIYNSYEMGSALEKGDYVDINIVLEGDMLTKVDRMCMRNSLEARVPFLDSKIVEAAFRMPIEYKLNGKNKKYILKETFKDLLPKRTLKFSKKGFSAPIDYWLKSELNEELRKVISKEFIRSQNIFNHEEIQHIYNEHMNETENHAGKLWNFFVFQKWYQRKILEQSKLKPIAQRIQQ
ncbi:MAG: asparagine synthase (glutamine-hydrolyzing) [Bacteroidetes bacterium]|nr:asparagine synthase (glutamine-hydrolyzing) [Bacteroidota bacterium]